MLVQMFGIIFTISQGQIIDSYGTLPGNIFLCVFLTLGVALTGELGPSDKTRHGLLTGSGNLGPSVRISPTDRGTHAGQRGGLVRKAAGEAITCFDGMSLGFGDKRPLFESQTVTLTSIAVWPWTSKPTSGSLSFLIYRMGIIVRIRAVVTNSPANVSDLLMKASVILGFCLSRTAMISRLCQVEGQCC